MNHAERRRPVTVSTAMSVLYVAIPVSIVVAASIYMHWRWIERGFDDAYISYRYALNFVNGHGLVFNPGDRVEGYSNLLYTLLAAVGIAIVGPDHIYDFSVVVNSFVLAAAVVLFYRTIAIECSHRLAFSATVIFASFTPMWWAVWSGMETPLVILFFLVAWSALVRIHRTGQRRWYAALAVACVLIVSIRADGFVSVFFIFLWTAYQRKWKACACAAVAGGATLAILTLWRLSYYGLPLPNTFYVKVTGNLIDRLRFAFNEIQTFLALLPYLAAILAVLIWDAIKILRSRGQRSELSFEPCFAACWLAYWFYVGGDVFGMRFLLVLVPLGLHAMVRLGTRIPSPRAQAFAMATTLVVMLPLGFHIDEFTKRFFPDRKFDPLITLGNALANAPNDAILAVDAAGKVPFYSGLKTIDMFGLNDREVAKSDAHFFFPGHSKSNPGYVLRRNPDLVTCFLDFDLTALFFYDRPGYRNAGYDISYMVYMRNDEPEEGPVIDVRHLGPRKIRSWYQRGYTYAVLSRGSIDIPATRVE